MPKFNTGFLEACARLHHHVQQGTYVPEHFAGLVHRYLAQFFRTTSDESPFSVDENEGDGANTLSMTEFIPQAEAADLRLRAKQADQMAWWLAVLLDQVKPDEVNAVIDIEKVFSEAKATIGTWRRHKAQHFRDQSRLAQIVRWMSAQVRLADPGDDVTLNDTAITRFEAYKDFVAAEENAHSNSYKEISKLSKSKRKWKKEAKKLKEETERFDEYINNIKEAARVHRNTSFDDVWPELVSDSKILSQVFEILKVDGANPQLFNVIRGLAKEAEHYRAIRDELSLSTDDPIAVVRDLCVAAVTNGHNGAGTVPRTMLDAAVEKVHHTGRTLKSYADQLTAFSMEKK